MRKSVIMTLVLILFCYSFSSPPGKKNINGTESSIVTFVDKGVKNYEGLVKEFEGAGDVYFLATETNGLEEMAAILKKEGYQNLKAIHVVSHGEEGMLNLGNYRFTEECTYNINYKELGIIKKSLSDDGDFLVYACNYARGKDGKRAVKSLARALNADVAASLNLTGSATKGADWNLEVKSGNIESPQLRAQKWEGTLLREWHKTSSNDELLRGDYIEIGLRDESGTFGSVDEAPDNWHARGNSDGAKNLGFVSDAAKNGWDFYRGDFFFPGTPEQGFGVEVDGVAYNNNTKDALAEIPGSFIDGPALQTIKESSALNVTWSGEVADQFKVTRKTTILEKDLFILFDVVLKNTSSVSLNNVFWMENVDPDNDQTISNSYTTTNTIEQQNSDIVLWLMLVLHSLEDLTLF